MFFDLSLEALVELHTWKKLREQNKIQAEGITYVKTKLGSMWAMSGTAYRVEGKKSSRRTGYQIISSILFNGVKKKKDLWAAFMQKLFCSVSWDPGTLPGGVFIVWTQAPAFIPAPPPSVHTSLQLAGGMSGPGR